MNILDVTIDFETCALCPTAAVMTIGAVAWDRNNDKTPFMTKEDGTENKTAEICLYVDLCSEFADNFTFDQKTSLWWSEQSDVAKKALIAPEYTPRMPIADAVAELFEWINAMKEHSGADAVCLWSQGSDFDIAILRNICYKYKIDIPVYYTFFRDHRSVFFEHAYALIAHEGSDFDTKAAYSLVEKYKGGETHTPVYDCKKSIYSTWQIMRRMQSVIGL